MSAAFPESTSRWIITRSGEIEAADDKVLTIIYPRDAGQERSLQDLAYKTAPQPGCNLHPRLAAPAFGTKVSIAFESYSSSIASSSA